MDAKSIKVNCAIPGPALTGCHDLCRVLTDLGQLIIDNGGQGFPLSVVLTPINRNAPLASTVATVDGNGGHGLVVVYWMNG